MAADMFVSQWYWNGQYLEASTNSRFLTGAVWLRLSHGNVSFHQDGGGEIVWVQNRSVEVDVSECGARVRYDSTSTPPQESTRRFALYLLPPLVSNRAQDVKCLVVFALILVL